MKMDDVERAAFLKQRRSHAAREIEAPKLRMKIADADAIEIDGSIQRHIGIARAIDVGRENAHLVTARGQRAAESVHRVNRSAVACRWQVCWDDVEDAHAAKAYTGYAGDDAMPA